MSECELPTFFEHAEPIARKQHRCMECRAPILKGEKHFHGWGKYSFGFESYRQHLACMEACMAIRDDFNGGECIGFGELKEYWSEMRGNVDRDTPHGKKLRHLMAVILWRERSHERTPPGA